MKIQVFVGFHAGRANYRRISDVLGAIKCTDGLHGEESILCGCYSHTFDADDSRLPKLRRLLASEGITWSEREEHVYTDAEFRTFPLIELAVEMMPLEVGGLECGTTFDLSQACPRCGTGAIQTSPLRLRAGDLRKKKGLLSTGGDGEILVSAPLMQALRDEKVTGLELRQVVAKNTDEPLPWWQMMTSHEMPKMSPSTRGIIQYTRDPPCPECLRDQHYHTDKEPCQIMYARRDVDIPSLPDIVRTWESFGRSGIDKERPQFSRYGEHRTLVKPKVFDIFRRLKVKHALITPVRFVD